MIVYYFYYKVLRDNEINIISKYKRFCGLVSLFNGISTFANYLMPKPSLLKNCSRTIWYIAREIKSFFSIVNVIPVLEFELAYKNVVDQDINQSTMKTICVCVYLCGYFSVSIFMWAFVRVFSVRESVCLFVCVCACVFSRASVVIYWPRPSCQNRKSTCVNNRCIRSRNIRICRGVELSAKLWRSQEEEWTPNYYITPATGISNQLEWRCGRENHQPAEGALRPPIEQL